MAEGVRRGGRGRRFHSSGRPDLFADAQRRVAIQSRPHQPDRSRSGPRGGHRAAGRRRDSGDQSRAGCPLRAGPRRGRRPAAPGSFRGPGGRHTGAGGAAVRRRGVGGGRRSSIVRHLPGSHVMDQGSQNPRVRRGEPPGERYGAAAPRAVRRSAGYGVRGGEGQELRRNAGAALHRASARSRARRITPHPAVRVRRLRDHARSVFRPQVAGLDRAGRCVRGGTRPRRRRVRGGLAPGRQAVDQAEYLAGLHCVRRVSDRAQVHGGGAARGGRWQRRRHHDRTRHHGPARPVCRRARRGRHVGCRSGGAVSQRATQHSGVRQHQDGGRIQGSVRNERVPSRDGWHRLPRGLAHDRYQRSPRYAVAAREAGGASAGRDLQRQADTAAGGL